MDNFFDELEHYGTPRHSGRYPWGSGDTPYQRSMSFTSYVDDLRKKGLNEKQIAESIGMTTTQLRARISIAKSDKLAYQSSQALKLLDKGYSKTAIAERLGISEANVRYLLKPAVAERQNITRNTADVLKKRVDDVKYLDIGSGTEAHMGISRTKLMSAVELLKEDGYQVNNVYVEQLGTGDRTTVMVLSTPESTWSEVQKNRDQIRSISEWSEDGGRSYLGLEKPRDVASSRIQIKYAEEGGIEKDGVIELRRGVDDISLGNSKYAQVRISVDGTHYLKGMAMYADDLPDGIDIRFNTNKKLGTPPDSVFKKQKDDPDNPFGATVRQRHYIDADGNDQLSALNIVNEEGDWGTWSKSLSSQMLSKQSWKLAKKQLDLDYQMKQQEYEEISNLTNPIVKKKLLESFAEDCASSAVHLKAAGLPRQGSYVILPMPDIPENEIYAPNYKDGERVVLIRYPHGGKFEIPELTVNNHSSKHALATMKNAVDAVGINSKVAERLSGADFDGDSVLVIPNPKGEIKTSPALAGLKDFDPKTAYPAYEGMPRISVKRKNNEMGNVSNLITDMTIKGASEDEICRAVKHSMVVIDSEKHYLNYKQSYEDNGIAELKEKYQGRKDAGSSTLISKASSEARVPKRKEITNPKYMTDEERAAFEAGKKVYRDTGETYTNKTGKELKRQEKSTKMAEVFNRGGDAYDLSSGTVIEGVYADYANKMMALSNSARKEYYNAGSIEYSPSAKKTYAKEVQTLTSKLLIAQKNAPLERQAQIVANSVVKAKKEANPDMDADELKKKKGQALTEARLRTGASKQRIQITPNEWEAIQAGAVSTNTLTKIVNNTDLDVLRQYATPRTRTGLSDAKLSSAKSMKNRGYTTAEIAESLGVSTSTIINALNE